ncbi:MAG: DUF1801 domain-containing protein [Terriglobales bacterium]
MKKKKSGTPKSPTKRRGPATVDEYISGTPELARSALKKIRTAIRSALPPDATETISYRIPAFRRDKILVWFAAFSNHCSVFPTAAVIEEFKNELKGLAISKGTIHFPLDKPVPTALIKKLVAARLEQAEGSSR